MNVHHIQLRTFPSGDRAFQGFARSILEGVEALTPTDFQAGLRTRYPAAAVRSQSELARRGDEPVVWYAFRYGTIAGRPSGAFAFDWDDPSVAEAIIDDERRFVALNDALVAIVELPRDAILGHAIEEFTNPEDPSIREDLAALWAEFVEAREAESTIRFNRADGRLRELAYRIVADDPERGRHRLRVRELAPD